MISGKADSSPPINRRIRARSREARSTGASDSAGAASIGLGICCVAIGLLVIAHHLCHRTALGPMGLFPTDCFGPVSRPLIFPMPTFEKPISELWNYLGI